ncbi:MAG: hypothetical protein GY798_01970, partial [Hyphomicrobiales bacterium]|nr:hypothetical protein [Hyphomicrobiales bacterium]
EALSNRIHGLELAIDIIGSTEKVELPVKRTPPKNTTALVRSKIAVIRAVLAASRRSGLSVSGVVEAAKAQGVSLKKTSVGSVLSRMKHKGEVTHIDGRYHLIGQN